MPEGPLKGRFNQFDRDKDNQLTRAEYDGMKHIFETVENVALAIRPGGSGDVTESHVRWTQNRYLPYVPSPHLLQRLSFLGEARRHCGQPGS